MDNANFPGENRDLLLATIIEQELEALSDPSSDRCIFRVPPGLRQVNRKAFTPEVVSIGPLHYGRDTLRLMEEHKKRYLRHFLRHSRVPLLACLDLVRQREPRLRSFYAETIRLNSDQFVKMVLVDATFVLGLFLNHGFEEWRHDDHMHSTPRMIYDIRLDLCLLENQLPFFILEELFQLAYPHRPLGCSAMSLCLEFLKFELLINPEQAQRIDSSSSSSILHLVDLLKICVGPASFHAQRSIQTIGIPNATELHHSGVKFQASTSKNLFDISFHNGVLVIPRLSIDDSTEILFRNVMAYEQRRYDHRFGLPITDYVSLMSFLVYSKQDVEFLVQKGVIENSLRGNQDVPALLRSLSRKVVVDNHNFYFAGVVEDLNAYYIVPRHKWKATLKQEYFDSPWSSISVAAAVILLVLTFIQAVCSVLQV